MTEKPVTLAMDYLTIKQTAEYLHVSPQTIRNYLDAGTLEFRQPSGPRGKILVLSSSIEKLLAK